MKILIDKFIGKTVKWFLIIFGLATCLPIMIAVNLKFSNQHLFSGLLDYTPATIPALRHWGIMVFGIGVLMIVSAFRPHLRFATMVYSTIEKAFMVYLFLDSIGQPWAKAYIVGSIIDFTIVVYSLIYFVSSYGRLQRWIRSDSVV
jgi:hypothetical protein